MIQTKWVVEQLHRLWPDLEITIEQIRTRGDHITNVPLAQIGGDGVFVTEIEHALHEGRIDLAVHSLKDLPTAQPDGLLVLVPGPREDIRDVFISSRPFHIVNGRLQAVNANSRVDAALHIGTGSLRRSAQLRTLSPGVEILPLRGNVDTRLRKLDAGDYDGIILAAAGLHRLNLQDSLAQRLMYFPVTMMMPAPGQGALGLEIRDEPAMYELIAPLNDRAVQAATIAERMFMRHLGAGCYLPVAAYGEVVENRLTLQGLVISLDGQRSVRVSQSIVGLSEPTLFVQAEQLGMSLAEEALAQGANEIISAISTLREQVQQRV
jgi:hydroxymethylbilane synthase